ncbi:Thioester reductase domain-containing protein [Sulfidibacter corallicola]|uniref:Thioester reductase domain-containing protein n=1 Tax=Sulfidibacter corallicola TaxID=2818388 RepID=A0A8A4TE50_SULCO|nr:thioester reductase domain-containing protein [Sulfidibacter corallicola]QTD48379.1 thioester reductase domain-containing protein [Sulfidibacter corallicola]
MTNGKKTNIQAIYPLSPMQKGILFHALREEGSDAYFMQLHGELAGRLDPEAFREAWLQVVMRHDVFRTLFVWKDRDEPIQVVLARIKLPWRVLDWRDLDAPERDARLASFLQEDRREGLKLDKAPLMRMTLIRTADDRHWFVWSTHHILLDAWCKKLVLNEVATTYGALVRGREPQLPSVPPYQSYIRWLKRQDLDRAEGFWRSCLDGFGAPTRLPRDTTDWVARGGVDRDAAERYGAREFRLSGDHTDRLVELARAHRLTVNTLVQACWAATLHAFGGDRDLVFGVTLSGRPEELPGVASMIGLFINTLPMRIAYRGDRSLRDWMDEIQARQMDLTRYGYTPLFEIQGWSKRSAGSPLFESILIFQNYPREAEEPGPEIAPSEHDVALSGIDVTGTAAYPLSLTASLRRELSLQLNFDRDQFRQNTVDRMVTLLERLLNGLETAFEEGLDRWIARAATPVTVDAVLRDDLVRRLDGEPGIADAAIALMCDGEERTRALAYVVPNGALDLQALRTRWLEANPELREFLGAIVPVTAIPLTAEGRVDLGALRGMAHWEACDLDHWQGQAAKIDGVRDAAVVIAEERPKLARLHLDDLLPSEARRQAEAAQSATPERDGAEAGEGAARELALADGGPLQLEGDEPATLSAAFLRTARLHGEQAIIHAFSDGTESVQSYRSLFDEACRVLGGLQAQGLGPKDRVVLQIVDPPRYFATFWACILGGIQPVTVAIPPAYTKDHALVQKLHNAWLLLARPTILASAGLVEPLDALRDQFDMADLAVIDVDALADHAPSERFHEPAPDDTAFFQLTSGSTGTPKCIQERHKSIVAHILGSKQHNRYVPGDRFMNWLPMDHIGSILKYHTGVLYGGYTQVQAATDLVLTDPLQWLDLMARHKVTHSWSANFGFKLVVTHLRNHPERTWDLAHLKFLLNAGEQVTMPVLRDFLELVAPFGIGPKVFQPAFGMAETCTGISYQTDFALDSGVARVDKGSLGGALRFHDPRADEDPATIAHFVSLGPPIPGVKLRIVDNDGALVPEGVIGRFQVLGDMVHPGYLNNEEANREAFLGDGWFNTGDLGFIRDKQLFITGREKETIVINGANFYCYEIEELVNDVDGVEPTFSGASAVVVPPNDQEELAIFFVPEPGCEDFGLVERIRAKVAAAMGLSATYVVPMTRDDFPKTTSGKIQRGQLRKRFESGAFADILKQVDLHLGNARTLPNWFYRPLWRRDDRLGPVAADGRTLALFHDGDEAGRRLESMDFGFDRTLVVVSGSHFERIDAYRFQVDPADPAQWAELFDQLHADHLVPDKMCCAWLLGDHSLDRRVARWLPLLQTLGRRAEPRSLHLQWLSLGAQAVLAGESGDPDSAAIRSLLATAAGEVSELTASSVDVDRLDGDGMVSVVAEVSRGEVRDVAWRDGMRYSLTLSHAAPNTMKRRPLPLRPNAMVLVSGGLGGIGTRLANFLVERLGLRLLLIGRTPLEALSDERRQDWAVLSGRSQTVAYEAVDITDRDVLADAVARWERIWSCRLDAVFHLAGASGECPLAEETPAHFQATLAAKVQGARVLHDLLRDRPEALWVAFSSVNGHFGGNRYGAYATACGFLDAFAAWRRAQGFANSHTLAWTQWHELGMSAGFRFTEAARARGFLPLDPEEGMHSLLAALCREPGLQLIGLDHGNPQLGGAVAAPIRALQTVRGFYEGDAAAMMTLNRLYVCNAFGSPVPCTWRRVETLTRDAEGLPDVAHLMALDREGAQKQAYLAPRTDLEKELAAIWQELLQVAKVGVHDHFFELGGHSITATQLVLRIRKALGLEMSIQQLFDAPTVAQLAVVLGGEPIETHDGERVVAAPFESDLQLDPTITAEGCEGASEQPRRLLLTGATGFVGAFLLDRLLREPDVDLWCPVRATDPAAARARLDESLARYRIDLGARRARVHVVVGDLEQPRLGLSEAAWTELAENLDAIYHNGARVNFVLPYSALRAANVTGTVEILRLATTIRLKPVHYVSTLSAIPAELHADRPFPEEGEARAAHGDMNGYERSKWVAEALVGQSMSRGLPATILRLGRVSGHSVSGACASDDMMVRLIQGSVMAGVAPRVPLSLQMAPVDFICGAMVALTRDDTCFGKAFHLFNRHGADLDTLFDVAREAGFAIEKVAPDRWRERVVALAAASPDNPLFPLLASLVPGESAGGGTDRTGGNAPSGEPYADTRTRAALAAAGITYPPVDADLLRAYFRYFREAGLLIPPNAT